MDPMSTPLVLTHLGIFLKVPGVDVQRINYNDLVKLSLTNAHKSTFKTILPSVIG